MHGQQAPTKRQWWGEFKRDGDVQAPTAAKMARNAKNMRRLYRNAVERQLREASQRRLQSATAHWRHVVQHRLKAKKCSGAGFARGQAWHREADEGREAVGQLRVQEVTRTPDDNKKRP